MGKRIDFTELNDRLLINAESYLRSWFPAGKRYGNEFKIGNVRGEPGDSLSFNLRKGVWTDFSTGQKGSGLLSLYKEIHGIGWQEAAKELASFVPEIVERDDGSYKSKKKHQGDEWEGLKGPAESPPDEITHYKLGLPSYVYCYYNGLGLLLGMVCRFDLPGGKKEILPRSWCKNAVTGELGWRWKSFAKPRPLYGLEVLANSTKPVLIVEGEKACDAARLITNDYDVITWPGGAKAIDLVDWKPIKGRDVYIWPDNDQAGIDAGKRITKICQDMGCKVRILQIDYEKLPKGFDIADAVRATQ